MIKRIVFTLSVLVLLLTTISILVAEDVATYNDDIKPILQGKSCIGCHSYMNTYEGLIAKVSSTTEAGVPIVNTEAPDSSVILWRLLGEKPDGTSVTLMPQGGAALPAETIALIRTWIEQGAAEEAPVGIEETKTWSEIKKKFREE